MKRVGNKFLTAIENWVLGMRLSEYHSGFRAYSREALQQVPFERCTDQFHFDTQILIQFLLTMARNPTRSALGPPCATGSESSSVSSSIASTSPACSAYVQKGSAISSALPFD